jgi:hypothetical protein
MLYYDLVIQLIFILYFFFEIIMIFILVLIHLQINQIQIHPKIFNLLFLIILFNYFI